MRAITFVFFTVILFLVSCGGGQEPQTASAEDTNSETTRAPEETSSEPTMPTMNQDQADRSTLDGFWTQFQAAVKAKDGKAIEALYGADVEEKRLFSEEEEINKITESTVADVKDSGQVEEGEKVYQFMMSYRFDEVEMATILSIKKNMDGNFEIFSVVDAG